MMSDASDRLTIEKFKVEITNGGGSLTWTHAGLVMDNIGSGFYDVDLDYNQHGSPFEVIFTNLDDDERDIYVSAIHFFGTERTGLNVDYVDHMVMIDSAGASSPLAVTQKTFFTSSTMPSRNYL